MPTVVITEPVKPKEPVKIEPKSEPPKPVITGNFSGLSLVGIRLESGKLSVIWELSGKLVITEPGGKFSHFRLVTAGKKDAEVEDLESGIRKRFLLDL